jgi:hypothetical protein
VNRNHRMIARRNFHDTSRVSPKAHPSVHAAIIS